MFLQLNHQKLEVYRHSKQFVFECYKTTKHLPADEKFNMIQQIRRAALSVHLNIAEGASRKSLAERKRFYEIARSSMVEIDSALDIAAELGYMKEISVENIGQAMITTFKLLTGLINAS